MIFDVLPAQIEALDQKELVLLLRRLLHAEAQKAGIDLRGVSVPLQITVADGGEDARIHWTGGAPKTDYIPSRFTVLQSKATDPGPAGWKKEAWTKASQKKGSRRKLNTALSKVITERGSYVGFTSTALVGPKLDDRVSSIRSGILEAGADPDLLEAIEIYDANKIAEWSSRHPSVAVWLNERQAGLSLSGFQTVENFGKQADFSQIKLVADRAPRYSISNVQNEGAATVRGLDGNALTFDQVKERVSDHLSQPQHTVRLVGPSGLGKTRFVFELLRDISTLSKESSSASAILCDFRSIGQQLFPIVQKLAEQGNPSLIVVDECVREAALQLGGIVSNEGSALRLLTIDIDDRQIQNETCLNVSISPSDAALVEGIIKQRLPKATQCSSSWLRHHRN